MERHSVVLTASIEFEGQTHTAAYFIENDVIHVNLGGRLLLRPLGDASADQQVKALLSGALGQTSRKLRQLHAW